MFFPGKISPVGYQEKKEAYRPLQRIFWGKIPPNLPHFEVKRVQMVIFNDHLTCEIYWPTTFSCKIVVV
jgi:hypothetical protein